MPSIVFGLWARDLIQPHASNVAMFVDRHVGPFAVHGNKLTLLVDLMLTSAAIWVVVRRETGVVWLITQRSRVQIPPPLPRPEALSEQRKGFCMWSANGFVNAARPQVARRVVGLAAVGGCLIARCSNWCYVTSMSSQPEITQRDLRMRSKEIMDAVERGQAFTVTRDGHRIGELVPLRQRRRFVSRAEFAAMSRSCSGDRRGRVPGGPGHRRRPGRKRL